MGFRSASLGFLFFVACNNYDLLNKLESPDIEKFTDRLYVFVTEAMTRGDMAGLVPESCFGTGLSRADCACQTLARKNHRRKSADSKFVAWLSITLSEMRCRIIGSEGLNCTPTGNHIWYNTNSEPVFSGLESATTGVLGSTVALPFAAKYTESGALIPSAVDNVWTGTNAGGITGGNTCGDWTIGLTGTMGRVGYAEAMSSAWTNASDVQCDQYKRVYCFALP